jgi:hypothetical protein
MLLAFGIGPLCGETDPATPPATLQTVTRAMDGRWFDGWRTGSLRAIAAQDLGDGVSGLDAADHVHVVACAPGVATDLGYLQAAWDTARGLIARGASLVLDVYAMRFLAADQLQAAGQPLDVAREVRVIYETASTRADLAHALHTRGMKKFGAPDLVALCSDADAALVGLALAELADQVARGTDLATPMHAVTIAAGVTWVAIEDEHGLGELLQLNNAARVIVDDAGHDLVGVVARSQLS